MKKMTFGLIVGNRGFFPDELAANGRKELIAVLKKLGYDAICLSESQSKFGSVETYEDAKACAELFKKNKNKIDGIIVTLPNFGDERGVANSIRMADLNVPVLVQAEPDNETTMTIKHRRDSFCGKISVCNNLRQYGIPFTMTTYHTESIHSLEFAEDLTSFAQTCRIVNGFKSIRVGAIGTRPPNFNTVRYSEKLLELNGITVEPVDLYEFFGNVNKLAEKDAIVKAKLEEINSYIQCKNVPKEALLKMAKFGAYLDKWMKNNDIDITAIQCWTAMEEFFGIVPCSVMSMLSNKLMPSACEVDVCGALSMYAMQLASGKASALADWNNNYGDDPDKCILFHCSNYPKSMLEKPEMDYQAIIAGSVGKSNAFGSCVGRLIPGNFSYTRMTTDDVSGEILVYTGEGCMTNDKLSTFGGYGVAQIPELQDLLSYICDNGFEHHVAINYSQVADAVTEAFENYLGWDVYLHS